MGRPANELVGLRRLMQEVVKARKREVQVVSRVKAKLFIAVSAALLSVVASPHVQSQNLILGIGYYPSFDAGTSVGAIHSMQGGAISDPLDFYETWSGGPHDLVNTVLADHEGLAFDRGEGLAFLKDGQLVEWHLARKISNFVRDRGGRLYVASGGGLTILEKFSPTGESEWVSTLPGLQAGVWLTMDLAEDQCTLWYSGRDAGGIFQFDVCQRTGRGKVSDTPARAIRVLGKGQILAALPSGISLMDASGRVVSTVPLMLPSSANVEFVTISVSADRKTFWVAEGTQYGNSVVYQRSVADFALLTEYSVPRQVTTVLVVPEWRASEVPPVRRRGSRRAVSGGSTSAQGPD